MFEETGVFHESGRNLHQKLGIEDRQHQLGLKMIPAQALISTIVAGCLASSPCWMTAHFSFQILKEIVSTTPMEIS